MHHHMDNNGLDNCVTTNDIRNLPCRLGYKKHLRSTLGGSRLDVQQVNRRNWWRKNGIVPFFTKMYKHITPWKHTLKVIEINFGTNIMLYFTFIKFLFFLNLLASLLVIIFIAVPNFLQSYTFHDFTWDYKIILDVFQGTGVLENSLIFYGFYSNSTTRYLNMNYNVPLAYMVVNLVCLLFPALMIILLSVKRVQQHSFDGASSYGSIVYGRWVFSVETKEAAGKKHTAIAREITSTFKLNTEEEERKLTFKNRENKIIAVRAIINIFFIITIGLIAVCIYYVFRISSEYLVIYKDDVLLTLIFQFLPSLTLILLGKIVPMIFTFLIDFEMYSASYKLQTILIRMVFVRMFSLCVVYISLYNQIDNGICWENQVGQQMYKMLLMEFLVHLLSTFVINIIITTLIRLVKKSYTTTFDLPKNVLDIAYMQTIAWFGTFYSPAIPTYLIPIYFIMFYTKKFELNRTNAVNAISQKNHSYSTYMTVLLISFQFAFIPWIFCIGTLTSSSCGPFINVDIPWDVISNDIATWPETLQDVLEGAQSMPAITGVFLILSLGLYSYTARVSTNKLVIQEMKKHLAHLGTTKQHLRNIYHKYNIVNQ